MSHSFGQIETLFHQALAVPTAERTLFLETACAGNIDLMREVESLLQRVPEGTAGIAAAVQPLAADLFRKSGSDMQLPIHLGPYRLERKLGEGGMGVVYFATDARLGRGVAIKVISRALARTEEARARFLREARSAAALGHTNIATLHDVGQDGETVWLVMEYVNGTSLRAELRGPVDQDKWLDYARQIARALEHAHSRRIVHRDIKPENILIAEDGVLKIIDFGLARATHDGASATITAADAFVGTLSYTAPEVLTGAVAGPRSDIYSAGVVLYEMACGEHPFGRDTGQTLLARILSGGYTRRSDPHFAAAVIDRCLARDPAARFRDGGELAAALRSPEALGLNPPSAASPPVLAVMDFRNIGGAADADWLSTGIAETLSADLAKLKSVRIASRSRVVASLRRLGGTHDDAAGAIEVGRDLGAHWIVTGGFQLLGERIRVTAELIDCMTGDSLATEKVDGTWNDIFAVQDRVVAALLKALTIGFRTTDAHKILPPETRNLAAYEHYIRGRKAMYVMDPSSLRSAILEFEQAVALDADYAFAYSGLGTAHALLFISTSDPEDIARASRYLERAIELDPELAEPYPWLNNIRFRRNDVAGAVAAGRKAIELQPDLPEAHYFYGGIRYMMPEMEAGGIWRGAVHLSESIRLQPKFHAAWLGLGVMAIFTGRHAEAVRILKKAVEMEAEPDLVYRFVGARTLLAIALSRTGDWEQARKHHNEALESLRGAEHVYTSCFQTLGCCALGEIELRCGNPAAALAHLRRARRTITESRRIVGSPRLTIRVNAGLAAAYAASGETERGIELATQAAEDLRGPASYPQNVTFECSLAQLWLGLAATEARLGRIDIAAAHLERAREMGWLDLPWLKTDPELRPLGSHVAYTSLVDDLESKPQPEFPAPL